MNEAKVCRQRAALRGRHEESLSHNLVLLRQEAGGGSRRQGTPPSIQSVYLFDENGQRKDKFPTKPSDKGQKSYLIRGLEFSPDSQKIAVAQSDNIVFIYKVGLDWGEKKAICNKFPVSASVTSMTWPKDHPNELVFGLADGKIRMGILKSNKSSVLYATETYCVSLASARDGSTVISGHVDGSVYAYSMGNQSYKKLFTHHSVPYGLGYG